MTDQTRFLKTEQHTECDKSCKFQFVTYGATEYLDIKFQIRRAQKYQLSLTVYMQICTRMHGISCNNK